MKNVLGNIFGEGIAHLYIILPGRSINLFACALLLSTLYSQSPLPLEDLFFAFFFLTNMKEFSLRNRHAQNAPLGHKQCTIAPAWAMRFQVQDSPRIDRNKHYKPLNKRGRW